MGFILFFFIRCFCDPCENTQEVVCVGGTYRNNLQDAVNLFTPSSTLHTILLAGNIEISGVVKISHDLKAGVDTDNPIIITVHPERTKDVFLRFDQFSISSTEDYNVVMIDQSYWSIQGSDSSRIIFNVLTLNDGTFDSVVHIGSNSMGKTRLRNLTFIMGKKLESDENHINGVRVGCNGEIFDCGIFDEVFLENLHFSIHPDWSTFPPNEVSYRGVKVYIPDNKLGTKATVIYGEDGPPVFQMSGCTFDKFCKHGLRIADAFDWGNDRDSGFCRNCSIFDNIFDNCSLPIRVSLTGSNFDNYFSISGNSFVSNLNNQYINQMLDGMEHQKVRIRGRSIILTIENNVFQGCVPTLFEDRAMCVCLILGNSNVTVKGNQFEEFGMAILLRSDINDLTLDKLGNYSTVEVYNNYATCSKNSSWDHACMSLVFAIDFNGKVNIFNNVVVRHGPQYRMTIFTLDYFSGPLYPGDKQEFSGIIQNNFLSCDFTVMNELPLQCSSVYLILEDNVMNTPPVNDHLFIVNNVVSGCNFEHASMVELFPLDDPCSDNAICVIKNNIIGNSPHTIDDVVEPPCESYFTTIENNPKLSIQFSEGGAGFEQDKWMYWKPKQQIRGEKFPFSPIIDFLDIPRRSGENITAGVFEFYICGRNGYRSSNGKCKCFNNWKPASDENGCNICPSNFNEGNNCEGCSAEYYKSKNCALTIAQARRLILALSIGAPLLCLVCTVIAVCLCIISCVILKSRKGKPSNELEMDDL